MANEWRVFVTSMAILALAFAIVALSGCAEWTAAKTGVASHGAQASDAALEASLWEVCYASPVGAVRRRFQSADDVIAWQTLCRERNFAP